MEESLVGTSVAHFTVLRELGRGGMGVVYEARDEKLGRGVALKVLPASVASDPARKARFLREARAAAQIAHPVIATVYEIGDADGRLYIAMELVPGTTLRARLERAPLSPDEALDIGRQIASALSRAHAAGIVHRDLKPENVMLDDEGNVKILDFGIAKALGDEEQASTYATREGAILGTPGYMAPEQASGKKCDQRADVFAFGVMLHEMLSGVTPFRGGTPLELVASVLRDPPTPLPDGVRTTPEIRQLVTRCLDKSPDMRPNDGKTLVELLGGKAPRAVVRLPGTVIDPLARTIATPDAVVHSAAPAPTPPPKPAPKRVWLWVLSGFGGVLLVLVLIVGVYQMHRMRQLRARDAFIERHGLRRGGSASPEQPNARPDGRPEGPPLFQCGESDAADAGFGRNCDSNTVAFCDPRGRTVACCAAGLFPVGVDGVCACPPGGAGPEAPAQCPRAKELKTIDPDAVKRAVANHKREFARCIDEGAPKGRRFKGTLRFAVQISPDGRVYSARLESSSLATASIQTCALGIWRKMHFRPPGGTAGVTVTYPMDFDSN